MSVELTHQNDTIVGLGATAVTFPWGVQRNVTKMILHSAQILWIFFLLNSSFDTFLILTVVVALGWTLVFRLHPVPTAKAFEDAKVIGWQEAGTKRKAEGKSTTWPHQPTIPPRAKLLVFWRLWWLDDVGIARSEFRCATVLPRFGWIPHSISTPSFIDHTQMLPSVKPIPWVLTGFLLWPSPLTGQSRRPSAVSPCISTTFG